jgi:hypothetical protein
MKRKHEKNSSRSKHPPVRYVMITVFTDHLRPLLQTFSYFGARGPDALGAPLLVWHPQVMGFGRLVLPADYRITSEKQWSTANFMSQHYVKYLCLWEAKVRLWSICSQLWHQIIVKGLLHVSKVSETLLCLLDQSSSDRFTMKSPHTFFFH